MYGWLIVLLALLAVLGGLILTFFTDTDPEWRDDWRYYFFYVLLMAIAIVGTIDIMCLVCTKSNIKWLENQQEIIDISINKPDKGYDDAITLKVIEINQDIYKAKSSKEIWGIWSQYYYIPDELLVPITLNKIDSTKIK